MCSQPHVVHSSREQYPLVLMINSNPVTLTLLLVMLTQHAQVNSEQITAVATRTKLQTHSMGCHNACLSQLHSVQISSTIILTTPPACQLSPLPALTIAIATQQVDQQCAAQHTQPSSSIEDLTGKPVLPTPTKSQTSNMDLSATLLIALVALLALILPTAPNSTIAQQDWNSAARQYQ